MFAYGVNECSRMVERTCMSGGNVRAFPKKEEESPTVNLARLDLSFLKSFTFESTSNNLLSNGKAAGLCVCVFSFCFYFLQKVF